jgi:hypothetical protein
MAYEASDGTRANDPDERAARPTRPRRPGEIVLRGRGGRSLGALYRLEQAVAALPGVGDASVSVAEDGAVVLTVPPHAEGRVRQYLAGAGELGG